jgi:hypothetical protein
MDHSGAPEKQANSAASRKSDGKAMAAGGIKRSQDVLRCPQMTGHGALDPRYRWCAMSNKVTPFRHPSPLKGETPIADRIIFEIGADRFAVDFAITELNQKPAQVIPIQRNAMPKKPGRRCTQTIMTS